MRIAPLAHRDSLSRCEVGHDPRRYTHSVEVDLPERPLEAQLQLETDDFAGADRLAYGAMLQAAKGLIKTSFIDITDDPTHIVNEFRSRFFDTQIFFDKYAGGKFAQYLFRRHARGERPPDRNAARQLIEEAQLFLEATHACQARLASQPVIPAGGTNQQDIVT